MLGFFPCWGAQTRLSTSDATATGQGFLAAATGAEAQEGEALELGRSPESALGRELQVCWQSPAQRPVLAPPCPRPSRGDCAEIRDVPGPQSCAKGTGLPLCALCVLPALQVLTESFSSPQRLAGTEIRGNPRFRNMELPFLFPSPAWEMGEKR